MSCWGRLLILGWALAALVAPAVAQPPGVTAPGSDIELLDDIPNLPAQLRAQWSPRDMPPGTEPLLDDLTYYGRLRDLTASQKLTLADCVALAIANNTQLQIARLGPLGARVQIRRAQSVFDPVLFANASIDRSRRQSPSFRGITAINGEPPDPNSSIDTGALSFFLGPPTTEQHRANGNLGVRKLLVSGGELNLAWRNQRRKSNGPFQALSPDYTTEFELSLNQPLLRDFGLRFTTLQVRIARTGEEAARRLYEAAISDLIKRVETAYWLVVGTAENVSVRKLGLQVAEELLRQNEGKFSVGTVPRTSVLEAKADVARREADLIQAGKLHINARDALRVILNVKHPESDSLIIAEPADVPIVEAVVVNLDHSLESALANRGELAAARLDFKGTAMRLKIAENQLLPRLNVTGLIGTSGLGGGRADSQRPFTQIITDDQPDENGVEQVLGAISADITTASPYNDSYADSLGSAFRGDFYSYAAGIILEIPLDNAQAKADYSQSRVTMEQSRLTMRHLQETVTAEVKKAINDIEAESKAIEATRLARELAEENVRNQQARYEVGLGTTKDLLDFQDQLTQASAEEVRTLTLYRIDLAELRRVEGTLLDAHDVELTSEPEESTPWWAEF